jgi:pimeloyl-ACP methyl ester carboxylesterase
VLSIRTITSHSYDADKLPPVPARATFKSTDGLELVYWLWGAPGDAPPVVLHHGFVANARANWEAPGVVDALTQAGRFVIGPDARGHGESGKPHESSYYGEPRMARDLATLLDLLETPRVDLVGYSMGAVVALLLAAGDARVRRLVVGGVGAGIVECGGVDRRLISNEAIAHALSVEDPQTLEDDGASRYRALADALGSDREALLAHARAIHRGGVELGQIGAPTLVLAGDEDPLAIRPQVLADALPEARLQRLSGDHTGALLDPRFAGCIVSFLS